LDSEFDDLMSAYSQLLTSQTIQLKAREQKIEELTDTIGKLASHVENKPSSLQYNKNKGKKKMAYYVPKGCLFRQRKTDNRWEARIMIDGKPKTVACRVDKKYVYTELMKVYRALHPKKPTAPKNEKALTLFAWLDQWHQTYRMPKQGNGLSKNTIIMDLSMIRKIKRVFKDVKLKDLKASYIQERLNSMTEGRTAEGVYTVLKLALDKAKDRTGGLSAMRLVEKPSHERVRGRALTKEEINILLEAARAEIERDMIKFYVYTGCRKEEIIRTLVEYVNLSNETRTITGLTYNNKPFPDMTLLPNEVLIYGTKTRGSIRTMPIIPPLKPVLERLIANRDGAENLFNYRINQVRYFIKLIKEKTKIEFTIKDFRHTAATSFKDAGIPSSVYYRWFGWTDEEMSKTVYTHETDYEKKVSLEWAEKFTNY
jgi:integrase